MKEVPQQQLDFMDSCVIAQIMKSGLTSGRDDLQINEDRYKAAERLWETRNKLYKVEK